MIRWLYRNGLSSPTEVVNDALAILWLCLFLVAVYVMLVGVA